MFSGQSCNGKQSNGIDVVQSYCNMACHSQDIRYRPNSVLWVKIWFIPYINVSYSFYILCHVILYHIIVIIDISMMSKLISNADDYN